MNWKWTVVVGFVFVVVGFLLGEIILPPPNSTKKENSISAVATGKKDLSIIGTEVLRNVFDDGENTVYIKADRQRRNEVDKQLEDILNKKRNWEKQFPNKKVISISTVTSDDDSFYGSSLVAGLLICYEQR